MAELELYEKMTELQDRITHDELFVLYEMNNHVIEILQSDEDNPHPFDDNGGEPDGPSWYVVSEDLSPEVMAALENNRLGYRCSGLVIADYDPESDEALMNENFPSQWCGYSSRDVVYARDSR